MKLKYLQSREEFVNESFPKQTNTWNAPNQTADQNFGKLRDIDKDVPFEHPYFTNLLRKKISTWEDFKREQRAKCGIKGEPNNPMNLGY